MNIIVVHNGKVMNIFADSEESFVVIEGGDLASSTMREVQSKPCSQAEKIQEFELTGQVVARFEDLYVQSLGSSYQIGSKKYQANMGDGVDMFENFGKPVKAGTLLFQANLLPLLMDPETKEEYGL